VDLQGEFSQHTVLTRWTMASLHLRHGEVVMDDSYRELRRHLPIWVRASGRVLVTGLGLGCVVRGLLHNQRVESIDVVEISEQIVEHCGAEFLDEPRVRIHVGDAMKMDLSGRWDFAWHDLWKEDEPGDSGLQVLHGELMLKLRKRVRHQGAWSFPREFKRAFATIG
jgi:spermidine synthase